MNQRPIYPFSAIVGQAKMKLALILNVINPGISGVLIRGEKGTAKSTAVRALANILPEIEVIKNCPFNLDPKSEIQQYLTIREILGSRDDHSGEEAVETESRKVEVVELPVGATEDRVAGTLDIQYALKTGQKRVEPGILARAHRNILYVDEVNLLDDNVVDILLDAAAMGINTIEREGISFSHPARFTLVGTMNPEEGELRPQLLDRFGLCVTVKGTTEVNERVEIMNRRMAFDSDPEQFVKSWRREDDRIAKRISDAKELYNDVRADATVLEKIASVCIEAGVDGHRADIVILKTAKALCAWQGETEVQEHHVLDAAELALPHRVRRMPMMEVAESLDHVLTHRDSVDVSKYGGTG